MMIVLVQSSTRCEMCVSYTVSDGIFWDNNGGANYLLEWVAREEKPVGIIDLFSYSNLLIPYPNH